MSRAGWNAISSFLHRQGDFDRLLASSWVAAVASTSRAVCRTQGTRHPTVGHRGLVAEHAHAGDEVTSDPASAESTELSAEQNLRRNDLFDSLLHGLIDADILVTTQ